ncbi:XIAP-associated factor 1 isoform X1 [Pseudorca crassidens]|uniref:XIAP-associated factor 1 isoform X1 n=1 Tax=Pseudorca crassidens TaxID=82174 RepID=UPI00352F266C
MQEVQEPLSGNKLQVQQGTPALSPAEKGPARGPGRRGRSVFYARGWRDMHAVRPAWVRGGAAAQWEAWPLAPTPGVVETAGGSSTGRGRRQGLSGLAELQRGFLECPATGTLEQPWAEKSENPSLPGLWAGLLEHFQFCFSARKNRNSSKQKDSADQNMEGNFQACRNCKRSGAPGHLALHGAHSLLFKVLCPECKEPVLQDTMEEHGGGRHQQVGCAACQQSLPKHLLEIQEAKECQERPVECQFCELAVRLNKVDIHEHPCGRRTEVCPHCGQRIVLHMLARHRDECCGEQTQLQKGKRIPAPESNICCHYCNQMIPGNKYFHHVDRCRPISDSVTYSPVGKPDIPPSSLSSQAAEDQTSTAQKDVRPKTKNTSRFRHLSEKSTRQAPRGTNKTTDLPLKSDGKLRASSPVEDETAYDILRRCSQCGIVLPLPTLTQHQEKCWWLASSKGKQARSSS